jgi:starch-binding outer membrane protein, SusD/RagB family
MRNAWTTRPGRRALSAVAVAAAAALAGCDIDVPDLNNTALEELLNNPTEVTLSATTTGLFVTNRAGNSAANGYVLQLGMLGREAYNLDTADPRYINELLIGELDPGSPFGGAHWLQPYGSIKQARIIQEAAPKVPSLTDGERAAYNGFTKTIIAQELLRIIVTHDTNGAVIDIDADLEHDLGPIVDKPAVYTEIKRLLDEGAADLTAAGDTAFPFAFTSGYAGLDTPATYRQFNRAIRARVATYTEEYADALTALNESFIDTEALTVEKLNVGAYHTYSAGAGDVTNGLVAVGIVAHPALTADAQRISTGPDVLDERYQRKVVARTPASNGGISSSIKFTLYPSPESPLPIIRNEELILIRAEANLELGNLDDARADLDLIRDVSGGLPALPATATAEQLFEELLYNRRYSLMFEGGHRWIDARRFGRLDELKAEDPTLPGEQQIGPVNTRFPIPTDECNARPGEVKCGTSSRG